MEYSMHSLKPIDVGPITEMNCWTQEEIDRLLSLFESKQLDKSSWTHQAHMIVGIITLKRAGFYEGICAMRSGIIELNASHGVPNTSHSGYHETMTIFWMTVLDFYLSRFPELSEVETVQSFLSTPLSDKHLPFAFYQKEQLLSERFRSYFIPSEKMSLADESLSRYLI